MDSLNVVLVPQWPIDDSQVNDTKVGGRLC